MGYDGDRFVWENRRVRSEHVCIGEVLYQPGGSCGPRVQRDWQLVFLHSGQLSAAVDGKQRRLSPGQVGLFLPGKSEEFSFSETHATHHSWCAVTPSLVPGTLRRLLESSPESQVCSEVQTRLLAAGVALDGTDSEVARSVVDHIGLALLSAYAKAGTEHADEGVVAKAARYLEQHLFEDGCLQKAHLAANVSRNTLINRFSKELGMTPARYLWKKRAERGIAMLSETGHTIGEIAYACGFRDPFHFSRLVKGLQGVSPQNLRRQIWSTDPQATPSVKPQRSQTARVNARKRATPRS
mgnify:CR=1 FL=1